MNVSIAQCIAHYKTTAKDRFVLYSANGWKLEMMRPSEELSREKANNYFVFVVEDVYRNYFVEYVNGLEIFDATLTFTRENAMFSTSVGIDFAQQTDCIFVFAQNLRVSIERWALLLNCCLLITEQLSDTKFYNAATDFIRRGGVVITYSEYNQRLLAKAFPDMNACQVFLYQSSENESKTLGKLIDGKKTYDVAMVPCRFERRQNIRTALQAAGVSVLEIDNKWGAERDQGIAQCCILLNVHVREDCAVYEHLRCDRWLFVENGPIVVSEKCVNQLNLDCAELVRFVEYENIVSECLKIVRSTKTGVSWQKNRVEALALERRNSNRKELCALVQRLKNQTVGDNKLVCCAQYGTEHFKIDVTNVVRENLCSSDGWMRIAETVNFNALFGDVATNVPKALYLNGGYVLQERRQRPFVCGMFAAPKRISKVPIFIISHNRLSMLRRCIESIRACFAPDTYEILIHDNVSTYQPLIDYLKASGLQVFWNQRNELDDVALSVAQYFSNNSDAQYYAVTDPDIEFQAHITPVDTLTFYASLLDVYSHIDAVGPELRVDDIPDHYPLKHDLLERHRASHVGDKFIDVGWCGSVVPCAFRKLDTTFGLYRRNFVFHRLNDALLCHGDYCARHLDWYIDPQNMADDDRLYMQKTTRWGHWSSEYLRPLIKNQFC